MTPIRNRTGPLDPRFFEQPTQPLARALIGCVLIHGNTSGTIVETEAYLGAGDLAAHSARGITERTRVIFGPPGHAYIYFIYGMHECLNITAEPEGQAGCVLIRALEPLAGIETMRKRRGLQARVQDLANGPGKLTQALGITRKLYGTSMIDGPIFVRKSLAAPQFTVEATPRIGIRECTDWPLRFIWKGHPCLSRQSPPVMTGKPQASPLKR